MYGLYIWFWPTIIKLFVLLILLGVYLTMIKLLVLLYC